MAGIDWVKVSTGIINDEKMKIIEGMPEGDTLFSIWIKLIVLAGKANTAGYLYVCDSVPYTVDSLSVVLRKPESIIRMALSTFNRFQMLGEDSGVYYIVNWYKHQSIEGMDKVREQTRLRNIQYRNRQRLLLLNTGDINTVTANTGGKIEAKGVSVTSHANVTETSNDAVEVEVDVKNKNVDIKSSSSSKGVQGETAAAIEVYKNELKTRFPDINIDFEYEKYLIFYEGKNLPISKVSFLNWITKALYGNNSNNHNGNGKKALSGPAHRYKYAN